jgi:hypothetical protein
VISRIVPARTRRTLAVATFLLAVQSWAATSPAAVQGSILDDTGKPVAGARVLIAATLPADGPHFAAPPVITGPLVTSVTADSEGAYSVASLPAGQYVACAEAATQGLLDPCHWAASAPTFTVTAGTTTSGVNITMARGAIVPIHISDPQSLLQPVTGPVDFDLQIHAVTAKGHHYNANIQASSATSRDHSVTVPFGTAITILVLAAHFVVNDQSGNPVPSAGVSVTIPTGAAATTISYVVAGKK